MPDVVARVNGQPVALLSLVPMAKLELDRAADREKARPRVMRAALERYITRELLFQEAEARGIRPDDATVEQAYNQARLRHPREDDWKDTLQIRASTRPRSAPSSGSRPPWPGWAKRKRERPSP